MVEIKGINKAITLAKKNKANYWIDLNTENIYSIEAKAKMIKNNIKTNLMVVRPEESKTSLINIWNRNNNVFKWERQKDLANGSKIFFCIHNNRKYVKIIKPQGFFEVHEVVVFPQSIYN